MFPVGFVSVDLNQRLMVKDELLDIAPANEFSSIQLEEPLRFIKPPSLFE